MGCCGGFIGQVFNPVADPVTEQVVNPVIEQVVQPVVTAVGQTVQAALDNPLETAAIAAAIASGQPELIPYIKGSSAIAQGKSPEEVLKQAAIGYAGGQVGGAVGAETGSTLAGNVAGGTASGLLSGKPLDQSLAGGLTNTAISQVTPSGLLSSGGTSGTTATQDYVPELNIGQGTPSSTSDFYAGQGTTGANNMADNYYDYGPVPDFFNTGESVSGLYGDPNALQNSFYGYGGLGTEDPTSGFGSTPMTQAEIDATMQTYGGNSSLDAATQALIKRALAAGGKVAQGALKFLSQKDVVQGGLQTAGGLLQMQQSREAALQAQRNIEQAAGRGVAGSQFRPVGTTTRFGTSNFQVDPLTGQVISAGYTAAPEITSAQNKLLGLGASYLAQTPEEVAQQYLSKQYELLDPSRQRQLASIRNQAFQTGRGGLSVGSTGLRPSGAQGLMGANPELEAYYNALAQQDAQLAAQAQQAGQQQVTFGTGLFGQAGQLENMAQQPFALSQGLAQQSSLSGARAGEIGLRGAVYGGNIGTSAGATASPLAYGLSGLGNPNSLLGGALGTYLTSPLVNTGGAGGGITSAGMQNPTLDVYGSGYVPLGYANF